MTAVKIYQKLNFSAIKANITPEKSFIDKFITKTNYQIYTHIKFILEIHANRHPTVALNARIIDDRPGYTLTTLDTGNNKRTFS